MTTRQEFTPAFWLQVLTSNTITAEQIAVIEGCNIQTARNRVKSVTFHKAGLPYVCSTDGYLEKYRHTNRKDELRLIYGETKR